MFVGAGSAWALLPCAAGLTGACRGPASALEQVSLTEPPLVAAERLAERLETVGDTLALHRANDLLPYPS